MEAGAEVADAEEAVDEEEAEDVDGVAEEAEPSGSQSPDLAA